MVTFPVPRPPICTRSVAHPLSRSRTKAPGYEGKTKVFVTFRQDKKKRWSIHSLSLSLTLISPNCNINWNLVRAAMIRDVQTRAGVCKYITRNKRIFDRWRNGCARDRETCCMLYARSDHTNCWTWRHLSCCCLWVSCSLCHRESYQWWMQVFITVLALCVICCMLILLVIYVPDVQKWLVDVLNPITSWVLDQIRDVDER